MDKYVFRLMGVRVHQEVLGLEKLGPGGAVSISWTRGMFMARVMLKRRWTHRGTAKPKRKFLYFLFFKKKIIKRM